MTNKIFKEKSKITIEVDVAILKEDKYFVAYCPALELSVYGDTEEKAKKSFKMEVKIFIDETCKRGTLEKYLIKNGWRLDQRNYEPPRPELETLSLLTNRTQLFRQNIQIPVC